jgi:hypothetical protein
MSSVADGHEPILRGRLVYLRPAERDDILLFVRWLSDARTTVVSRFPKRNRPGHGGALIHAFFHGGRYLDLQRMAILREEWAGPPAATSQCGLVIVVMRLAHRIRDDHAGPSADLGPRHARTRGHRAQG